MPAIAAEPAIRRRVMSAAREALAGVMPLTYAVEALREVMRTGSDLSSPVVQTDLIVLAAIALVSVVLAATTIRREAA